MQGYQRGIARRYYANREGWDRHCAHTKECILSFAKRNRLSQLTLLGSGWLLDVPLEELLACGITVTLCDIAHPPQVQEKYSARDGVNLQTIDITGGLVALTGRKAMRKEELLAQLKALAPQHIVLPYSHAVVSVNLLSQLAYPLQEKYDHLYAEAANIVQEQHLELLKRFPMALCISDIKEEHYRLVDGAYTGCIQTVYAQVGKGKEWVWKFDRNGSYSPGERVDLLVHAWSVSTKA